LKYPLLNLYFLVSLLSVFPTVAGDPGSFLGINCGNAGAHDAKQGMERFFIKRNIATLNLAKHLGLGWARCGGGPEQWRFRGKISPERFDPVVDHANRVGIRVYLYIEYRGDINRERITDFDWREVGRAMAAHFGDRVGCYGIMNEVDHVDSPHTPAEVARAVGAFADGVHSVDSKLLVSTPSIGGTPMKIERADGFLRAIGPLINAGRVNVLNLHSYHDSRPRKPHFSNIDDSAEWAPSRNFLRAKRVAGIDAPVRFAAGEFNYRNWDGSAADRARGFMTALWDQLMVTASVDGERVGLFSMPYNVGDSRSGRQTTMARRFDWREDGTFAYEPNEKGAVLQQSIRLTRGMEFVHCDPHKTGVAVLTGDDRKAWVWQNRPAFSTLAGRKQVKLTGLPRDARSLKLFTADSIDRPLRTWQLDRQDVLRLRPAELPRNQTLLFVLDGTDDRTTGGITAE